METPPAQRAITPATQVRLTLRDQAILIGVIISLTFAAGAWATSVHRDISELRGWAHRFDVHQAKIEEALGIHRMFGPDEPVGGDP